MRRLAFLLCSVLVVVGCQYGNAPVQAGLSTPSWILEHPTVMVWLSLLWGGLQLLAVIVVILACLKYLFSKPGQKDWQAQD